MPLTCWSRHPRPTSRATPARPRRRATARRLRIERLEDRTLLAGHDLTTALAINPGDTLSERIGAAGEASFFQVTLRDSGRFTVQAHAEPGTSLESRTSLLDAQGQPLVQSDGQSAADPDDLIDLHLAAGTYFLEVTGLGPGTGAYTLTTAFQPATPPGQPLPVDFNPTLPGFTSPPFGAVGDFNGDGILDVATANTYSSDISILLGLGDGTFQAARQFSLGSFPASKPFGIVAGDFDRDGRLDLAFTDTKTNEIGVLRGQGDGTFTGPKRYACGVFPWQLVAADLNGDGFLDLVSANQNSGDVSVLLGRGDGTFRDEIRTPPFGNGTLSNHLAVGDFNGDGHPDLVVGRAADGAVVLLGQGDGTFRAPLRLTGDDSFAVATGDFNGDGRLDVAVGNKTANDLMVFLGRGDGTFQSAGSFPVGSTPFGGLVAGDFNGDGKLDLACPNRSSGDVSVLLGRGDGTFGDQVRYEVGVQPWDLLLGDFNGDGREDLAAVNALSHDVSLLLGLGDGTFQQGTSQGYGDDNPQSLVTGDFNGDGIPDLITASYASDEVLAFLGRGDGTFQREMRFSVGSTPFGLSVADFNGDGHLDLASANCSSADVSILLGRGDGTFQDQVRYSLGIGGLEFTVVGDFNGDGKPDVLVGGQYGNRATVLLGRGDGTFTPFAEQIPFAPGDAPYALAEGDFNGDGKLDIAVTHVRSSDHTISVYLGRGDGGFQAPVRFTVGASPRGLVAGDFNGDGRTDLAVVNFGSDSVSVLLGRGDGTFPTEVEYATGRSPEFIVAGDFNGDGFLDLGVTNSASPDVSLLLGRGDGTFQPERRSRLGDRPTPHVGIVAADLNGDGRLDLSTPQLLTDDVAVLLGSGDGGFQDPLHFGVGFGPSAVVTGDFNGDGRLDVAGAQPETNELSIGLGNGDATLEDAAPLAVGRVPVAVVTGDFNRDGRLDLATANFGSNDVSVFLGLGDGTFRPKGPYAVGTNPVAVVTGDFNGDGLPDLATANAGSQDISILLGGGDGGFRPAGRFAAGELPQALVAGDFNGDGREDLACADYRSQDVAVFLGRGDGTFQGPVRLALGTAPAALVAGDFNRDGRTDLATANYHSNDVSVLLGRGDGTFQDPVRYDVGATPVGIAVCDVDGDGIPDLATADNASGDVAILLGRGDGTFAAAVRRPAGEYPIAVAGADFTDDDHTDLAVAAQLSTDVLLFQGLGDMTFVAGGTVSNPLHATPLVADWNGDGVPDVTVVAQGGKILLRLARPGAAGVFEAPVVVNPDPLPAARDLAVLSSGGSLVLAALDARSPSLSLYARNTDGSFTRRPGPTVPGALPVRVAAGDLNGDGRDDLVVADAGSDEVLVWLQNAAGGFGPTPDYDLAVGRSPSDLRLVDVDGDGRPDIVVTNQFSGDVSVLRNDPVAPFASALRFRAGIGLYATTQQDGRSAVHSLERTAGFVAGNFGPDDRTDLVVLNSGSNSFSVLPGDGAGGFLNPTRAQTYTTGLRPAAVVVGRFNDDPFPDLAVLNEGSGDLSIFLGDGAGGFVEKAVGGRLSAGNRPTGLSARDVTGDGVLDVLVGNDFGDILILPGRGDGTFQPYQRVGRNVALAVADLNGDGRDDFVFGNEARDRVAVQYSEPGQAFVQDRSDGLLAPDAVRVTDLNGDGQPDLVVANSGANNVMVYLGTGDGGFRPAAQSFFAGTNPVGITVQDLNADGLPDLVVANEGSNDVTVLLGQGQGADWTLTPGPRLRAGSGPVSTVVQDVTGDGIPDLLVTNSQSNNVSLLPGLGGGFFSDLNPLLFATGSAPQQAFVGEFDGRPGLDLVTVNAGSNDLTFFSGFGPGRAIASGGSDPVAAVAGDFNHDGLLDLLVANHGDGRIALLLGGAAGLGLDRTFSSPDLPHPTALELSSQGGALTFYVAEEGEEAAAGFALVFGSATALAGPPEPPVRNPGFILFGPGFPGGFDIPAVGAAEALQAANGELEPRGLLAVLTLLVAGPVPPGGGDEAVPDPDAIPDLEGDLIRFLLGLPDGLPRKEPDPPANGPVVPEEALGRPSPPVEDVLHAVASVDRAPWDALGLGRLGPPNVDVRPVLDAVFAAGLDTVRAPAVAAELPRGGAEGSPLPARSGDIAPAGLEERVEPAAAEALPPYRSPSKGQAEDLPKPACADVAPRAGAEERPTDLVSYLAATFLASALRSAHRADRRPRGRRAPNR
jgi:large repetitive protein